MMQVQELANDRLTHLVIDNFLTEDEREALWAEICAVPLVQVHEGRWKKAFHVNDGEAWRGPNYIHNQPDQVDADLPALKLLGSRISDNPEVESFLATCNDWTQLSLQPYIYPAGCGLSWHLDGRNRAAALIYYAHPTWHPSWGGELLIAGGPTARAVAQEPAESRSFDRFYGSFNVPGLLDEPGGSFVFPSPNRLVVLRGETPHCIKKVDQAAGDAFRASVLGIFSIPRASAGKP